MSKLCRLLVLSPWARDIDRARRFTPFGKKRLQDILDEVAAEVALSGMADYDRHEIFGGFFYGHAAPDAALRRELLNGVPTSLVDCLLYNSGASAAEGSKNALFHFAFGAGKGGKRIILACNDACGVPLDYDAVARTFSDPTLAAHLWNDLTTNAFKRIGKIVAERQS